MKKQFTVWVGGEVEQRVGFYKAIEIYYKYSDKPFTYREAQKLKNGRGLYVDVNIFIK